MPGLARYAARRRLARCLVGSVILHALILPPLLLSARPGQPAVMIPLDIVVLADQTAGPPQPAAAVVPLQEAGAPSTPAAPPIGIAPSQKPPDELDIKLRALAELRQPSVDTHLSKKDLGVARQSAMSEEAAPGSYAPCCEARVRRARFPCCAPIDRRGRR